MATTTACLATVSALHLVTYRQPSWTVYEQVKKVSISVDHLFCLIDKTYSSENSMRSIDEGFYS